MADREHTTESPRTATVTVRVEPAASTRLRIGTRWEVVAASLDSLWQGAYTVTLQEIEDDRA